MGCGCNKKKEIKDLISRIQDKVASNAAKPIAKPTQNVKNLPVAPGAKKQAPKKK